jgi:hypothetical protein
MSTTETLSKKPLSVKLRGGTEKHLRRLSKARGLSLQDVVNLGLAAGLPIVEQKFAEMLGEKIKTAKA